MSAATSKLDAAVERVVDETTSMPEKSMDALLQPILDDLTFLKSHMKDFDIAILQSLVTSLNTLCSTLDGLIRINSPSVSRGMLNRLGSEASRLLLWAALTLVSKEMGELKLSLSPPKNSLILDLEQIRKDFAEPISANV